MPSRSSSPLPSRRTCCRALYSSLTSNHASPELYSLYSFIQRCVLYSYTAYTLYSTVQSPSAKDVRGLEAGLPLLADLLRAHRKRQCHVYNCARREVGAAHIIGRHFDRSLKWSAGPSVAKAGLVSTLPQAQSTPASPASEDPIQ